MKVSVVMVSLHSKRKLKTRSENNSGQSVLTFYLVGSRARTHVIDLGGKNPYRLFYLTSPNANVLNT